MAEVDRQCGQLRQQGRLLIEEKKQMQTRLQLTEETIIELRHQLGTTQRAHADALQEQVSGHNKQIHGSPLTLS
jgi:hypothetical protein